MGNLSLQESEVEAQELPALKVTKVAFDAVRRHLPPDVRTVSAEERREQIRIRQEHVQRRYRQY